MKYIVNIIIICFSLSINGQQDFKKILVFGGKTGYLGQKIVNGLKTLGYTPICAQSRLENRQDIINEVKEIKPDFIINAAGVTGKPNISWCEDHRPETIRANVMGTLNLIDVAYLFNIQVTNLSTGCIYAYDNKYPFGYRFSEEDEPNFDKAFYSRTKIYLEKLILEYPNVLNLRITMPVSTDFSNKNFIIRLASYKKVMNIPISITILEDLIPIAIDMTLKSYKGNYNLVNPGAISHNEILELYKIYLNPSFTYENFSDLEQQEIIKNGRSNCELNASKILSKYPHIPHVKTSMVSIFQKMKEVKESKEK